MAATARPRRSALYMPGSNTRALEKAKTLAADVVILDLEDAVSPDAKAEARRNIAAAVQAGGYGGREVVIRIEHRVESETGALGVDPPMQHAAALTADTHANLMAQDLLGRTQIESGRAEGVGDLGFADRKRRHAEDLHAHARLEGREPEGERNVTAAARSGQQLGHAHRLHLDGPDAVGVSLASPRVFFARVCFVGVGSKGGRGSGQRASESSQGEARGATHVFTVVVEPPSAKARGTNQA